MRLDQHVIQMVVDGEVAEWPRPLRMMKPWRLARRRALDNSVFSSRFMCVVNVMDIANLQVLVSEFHQRGEPCGGPGVKNSAEIRLRPRQYGGYYPEGLIMASTVRKSKNCPRGRGMNSVVTTSLRVSTVSLRVSTRSRRRKESEDDRNEVLGALAAVGHRRYVAERNKMFVNLVRA